MNRSLEILNQLHAAGKLGYNDYSELFDAIIDDLNEAELFGNAPTVHVWGPGLDWSGV